MPDPMTPEEVRRLRFKSVFRGFDPAQVSAQLNRIAESMETLIAERDELLNTPPPDPLKDEMEAMRHDLGEILDSARDAAAAMRSRAEDGAASILRKAQDEAVRIREEAADAAKSAPRHMADPDELDLSGEPSPPPGEESPETREPLLGKPLYPPGAPPGGWGAPAVRVIGRDYRDQDSPEEAEPEEVPTPTPVDEETAGGAVDDIGLHPDDAKFFEEATDTEEDWESVLEEEAEEPQEETPEETAESVVTAEPEIEEAEELDDVEEPGEAEEPDEVGEEPEDEAEEEAEEPVIPELASKGERKERIGSLFASLRGEDETTEPDEGEETAAVAIAPEWKQDVVYPLPEHVPSEDEEAPEEFEPIPGLLGEPFEIRETLLLPVTNRCLRGLKRQLADIQEDVVELAVDAEWEPDREDLAEEVRPALKVLVSEAFAAGHTAVQQWTEETVARPHITDRDPSTRFVAGLADEIESSLVGVNGERGRSSAVSRVLRAWRTDEAERRVRSLAHEAFHRGVLASVVSIDGYQPRWVVAGTGCSTCREKQDTVPVTSPLPPVHAACECVLGVATVTDET